MRRLRPNLHSNSGFTMVEIIIAVAVMSILVTMSVPTVTEFMRQRDVRAEQTAQNEILKSFQSYLAANNPLPDDSITDTANPSHWSRLIGAYSGLGEEAVRRDIWGNNRHYIRFVRTENYLGTQIPINYFTLISPGPNRIATAAANANGGIPVDGNSFASYDNSGWWSRQAVDATKIQRFSELVPGGDDLMVRYTDFSEKVARYNRTLERVAAINTALDVYSKQKYAEALVAGTPNAERLIYYPRANASGAPGDNAAYYYSAVENDLNLYNGGNAILSGDATGPQRRSHMVALMRILGLPDETCCSALHTVTGTQDEVPLFYFSNPRARTTSGCAARPDPRDNNNNGTCEVGECQFTLPPRITITYDANTTCG